MVDPNMNIHNVPGKISRELRKDKTERVPPKKDFKKVMERDEGEHEDKEEHQKQTKDVSTKEKETPKEGETIVKEGKAQGNLFTLSQDAAKTAEAPKEKVAEVNPEVVEKKEQPTPFFVPNDKMAKDEPKAQFSQEQPDIAYVNPMNVGQTLIRTEAPKERSSITIEQIQALVKQMVDKVQTMTQKGETDTTIVLKHPPILEGANLIIRSFDSARGEFNIAFENLTAFAKNMLDMQGTQDALKTALDNKGYVLHIVTTTTEIETPIIEEEGQAAFQAREEKEEQQQQQDQGETS